MKKSYAQESAEADERLKRLSKLKAKEKEGDN